jgi:hypothetical protein
VERLFQLLTILDSRSRDAKALSLHRFRLALNSPFSFSKNILFYGTAQL